MSEDLKLLDCDDVLREQLALCEDGLKTVLAKRDELDAESKALTQELNRLRGMRDRYRRALEPVKRKRKQETTST